MLSDLGSYVNRFRAALELINASDEQKNLAKQQRDIGRQNSGDADARQKVQADYAEKFNLFGSWQDIARRDAVMTIWDFAKTVYSIRKSLDDCKSLNEKVSRPQLEKVIAGLSNHFPDRKDVRDAAAHPADFTKETPKAIEKHKLKEEYKAPGLQASVGTFLYGATFDDGSVVFSHEGTTVSVKVNKESLDALAALRDEMYACFKDASEMAIVRNLRASMTSQEKGGS